MATRAWNPYAPPEPTWSVASKDDFAKVLTPGWFEISLVIVSLLTYGICAAYGEEMANVGNVLGPVLLSVSLTWAGLRLLRGNIHCLWVPLLWYRVSMFTYYGLGAAVPLFVNDDTRDAIMNFYSYYPRDMLKLNAVIGVFHLVVLLVSRGLLSGMWSGQRGDKTRERLVKLISPANFSVAVCGSVFLVVGAAANFLFILPVSLGWFAISAIGPLYNIALASLLGYFLLTYWALETRRHWVIALVMVFVALETMLGLLQMTKFVALFPGVMLGLAFIYHRPTILRLSVFGVTLFVFFMLLTPLIGYARNVNAAFYQSSATPAEVVEIYQSYNGRDTINDADANVQSGWARLSYVNAGTFAINQFDAGQPGDTYRYGLIVLVPRVIWANKPNVTDVAREFTYAVNGNYDSSSSPGIPAEAYYNLGWAGVLLIGFMVSVVLSFWSIYSYTALQRNAWHLFFVVLMGMRLGTRMDGGLVSDIIGPVGIALVSHIILEFLNRFLPQRIERWRGQASGAG